MMYDSSFILIYKYNLILNRTVQEKASGGSAGGGGGKMNEKMQMQDRLVDLVEENKGTYRLPLCSLFSLEPKPGLV
jgi:hypothetical protein